MKLLVPLNAAEKEFKYDELHGLIERFQVNTSGYGDNSLHKCTIGSAPNFSKPLHSAPSRGLWV